MLENPAPPSQKCPFSFENILQGKILPSSPLPSTPIRKNLS